MKSDTITIQQLFQDRRQFCVPFYQRKYVWTLDEQWERLWDDIREKAEARLTGRASTPHFLGAVVLEPQEKEGLIGVDVVHIIDGQQRLTTLQFTLKALSLAARKTGSEALIATLHPFLVNGNPDTMHDVHVEKHKLWPTFQDRPQFLLAMSAEEIDDLRTKFPSHFTHAGALRSRGVDHPPALAALWHFAAWMSEWLKADPAAVLQRANALSLAIMRDLKVVTIVLEKNDDAQVIFETLNGRGAQLHATDLIRNYVFMRADREGADAEALYEALWAEFESAYWAAPQRRGRINRPRLEWFIHAALQAEQRAVVDLGRLYAEYQTFAAAKTAEDQLQILQGYSSHYRDLVAGRAGSVVGSFGARIADYDITTLHPLALAIAKAEVGDAQKAEMLGMLCSFVVRRAVCGLGNKNYNNVFLNALTTLSTEGVNSIALQRYLAAPIGTASRWPSDADFRAALRGSPLYDKSLTAPVARAILTELESALRDVVRPEEKAPPDLSDLDIDHIMPKSWSQHWALPDGQHVTAVEVGVAGNKKLLGEPLTPSEELIVRRESLIQTIGNLTLLNLSVNREAKHFAFPSKRDLLIANTTLRLNVPLLAKPAWDEDAIEARGVMLADAAVRVWPGPNATLLG